MNELTREEKLECVVRWLNGLHYHWAFNIPFKHVADEVYELDPFEAKHSEYIPCLVCPLYQKCTYEVKTAPIFNFQVMEEFTGYGSVIR